jgi:ketosteroid isomerase-like protein
MPRLDFGRTPIKHPLYFAVSVLIFPALAYWQASKEPAPVRESAKVENEVKEAIHQRLDALRRGDVKAYISYYGEECIVTGDNGALLKPEDIAKEWADDHHSGIVFKGGEPMDVQVHAYGDMAVASFRTELDQDWAGQKLFESSRFTDVFARRAGRWLLVAHHETPIPNARRVAVKVDPAIFAAYAGEYQITPTFIVKVKREGDKLMDQWPGTTEFDEDIPVSKTTFVARGELGEAIYVKDESGKVSHFILRTGLGDLIAKKIK